MVNDIFDSEDKVLVPKPEKLKEFKQIILELEAVSKGRLGWKGQAEVFLQLDFEAILGYKLKSTTKEEQLEEIQELLKQAFLDRLLDISDLVSKEEAKTRMDTINTLYTDDIND